MYLHQLQSVRLWSCLISRPTTSRLLNSVITSTQPNSRGSCLTKPFESCTVKHVSHKAILNIAHPTKRPTVVQTCFLTLSTNCLQRMVQFFGPLDLLRDKSVLATNCMIRALDFSVTNSFIHLFIHLFIHSFIYYSFKFMFTASCDLHFFKLLFRSFVDSLVHSSISLSVRPIIIRSS